MSPIRSMDIYSDKVTVVHPTLRKHDTRAKLNDYQSMPKNTEYCECYYDDKSDDTWRYYLREIMNPDQAISKFFITLRDEPFFVSTKVEGDICKKDIIIRTYNKDHISIKVDQQTLYDGPISTIPNDIIQQVKTLLHSRGFDNHLLDF